MLRSLFIFFQQSFLFTNNCNFSDMNSDMKWETKKFPTSIVEFKESATGYMLQLAVEAGTVPTRTRAALLVEKGVGVRVPAEAGAGSGAGVSAGAGCV